MDAYRIATTRRSLAENKTKQILDNAEKGGYGIIASIVSVWPAA